MFGDKIRVLIFFSIFFSDISVNNFGNFWQKISKFENCKISVFLAISKDF